MTTERKAHHPLEGGSRISAYTFDPSELTLITDSKDPLYDVRVEDPIDRAFALNIAARGVQTAIDVRRRGAQSIVIRGKQRTKAVIVVNVLAAGAAYTGPIKAIHNAIHEFGADADFVKKVTLWVKKALKIRALPANAGDDRDARMSMRTENAYRRGDSLQARIRFAQEEHERYGTPADEIAANENVSVATVKRWLAMDSSTPRRPKKRGKASRPSGKQIATLVEQIRVHATPRELALLDWIQGRTNGKESVAEHFLGTASNGVRGEARAS